jgi:hypothetical protein
MARLVLKRSVQTEDWMTFGEMRSQRGNPEVFQFGHVQVIIDAREAVLHDERSPLPPHHHPDHPLHHMAPPHLGGPPHQLHWPVNWEGPTTPEEFGALLTHVGHHLEENRTVRLDGQEFAVPDQPHGVVRVEEHPDHYHVHLELLWNGTNRTRSTLHLRELMRDTTPQSGDISDLTA